MCALFLAFSTIAGCSGGGGGSGSATVPGGPPTPVPTSTPLVMKIQHVVVVIQENRSFDNLFATYPGADGATYGVLHTGQKFNLTKAPLLMTKELEHAYRGYVAEYDNGKMDGFDTVYFGSIGNPSQPAGTFPLRYVDPARIWQYWMMAKHYELADHMFQTQGSGSFTAHQDLIAGGTVINPTASIIDWPSQAPWGCDAPTPGPGNGGTFTSYITVTGQYNFNTGPFPCLSYKTLKDLLDPKGVSWKYYTPPIDGNNSSGAIWNAFDAIRNVRYGPDWENDVISPETAVLSDAAKGALPAVSWVIPCGNNSDHAAGEDYGPQWVASVVNAIGKSPAWPTTVILVVWDDWGGLFDHVRPPFIDQAGGLGFRVPMIAISPYSKSVGYVSHTQYEFGSIVRFIEDNWNLGRLGTTDERAASIADMFDFTKPPRAFTPIPSKSPPPCTEDSAPDDS